MTWGFGFILLSRVVSLGFVFLSKGMKGLFWGLLGLWCFLMILNGLLIFRFFVVVVRLFVSEGGIMVGLVVLGILICSFCCCFGCAFGVNVFDC